MSAHETDRNLLFGVLALQADFLDARQFAEACSAWGGRKDTPLADLLVERGWLTAEDRAHLEYLLERKLQRHDGDAPASLAAMATPDVRRALESVTDLSVRQSLAGLTPPVRLALATTVAYEPGSRQRYTLTRLHAKGGIGQVWLAHDEDLGRDVALKELRPDWGDSVLATARFLEEAKITGQVEHPGIVPVYELVQPKEGSPCYAMRFVGGRTLADAIRDYHRRREAGEAGPLELRELLTAFVGVCNAVAYAHSRRVLHRDLKPPNVALGDFGEVLVLDWGLAKVLGKAEEPTSLLPVALGGGDGAGRTQQGQVLGTPAYMAPEQAEGRLDRMDRRSDVYGLGAILYEILTGAPPFSGADTPEVLKRVVQEPPVPPRQKVAATPFALEAVCLKCLAKQPGDRYASAADVAREMQRWLADEPVSACPEPLAARAGRWVRRHRTLTAATAAAILVAALSLAAATWFLNAAKDREHRARAEAEANFALARNAVDQYLTKVSESEQLKSRGLEKLRQELLGQAREFYEKLVREQGDAPGLQAERGKAYRRLANITADIGSKADAIALYEQARGTFEQLARDHPEMPDLRAELARSILELGSLYGDVGQFAQARARYVEALAVCEALTERHPERSDYQLESVKALLGLGWCNITSNQPDQARASIEKGLAICEQLTQASPEVVEYREKLASCHWYLGNSFAVAGQNARAKGAYEQALRIDKELVREHPDNAAYQDHLALIVNNLGLLYFIELKEPARARATFADALALYDELVRQHPDVRRFRDYQVRILLNLCRVDDHTGQAARAEAGYDRCRRIAEGLLADQPDNGVYQQLLLSAQLGRCSALVHLGKYAEGVAEAEALAAKAPGQGGGAWDYALCCLQAQAARAAQQDAGLPQADRRKRSEQFAARAMDLLKKVHKAGFLQGPLGKENLLGESDLDPLRDRDDFQKLLAELEEKAKDGKGGDRK